jgi:hypothetical protein
MLIKKLCPITKKTKTMFMDITEEQLERIENRYDTDEYIQDIAPMLTPAQREFLMTGITPEFWDEMFRNEKND